MDYIIGGLSMIVFIKTIGYAMFEQKENKNNLGAMVVYILAVISLIAPNVVMHFI